VCTLVASLCTKTIHVALFSYIFVVARVGVLVTLLIVEEGNFRMLCR
jgi:hypothetical protein